MNRDRVVQLVCVIIAALAVAGSAALTPALNRQRRDLQLTYGIEIGDRLPAQYALLPALGSLRGLFVDILWYRSEMMKREGKFHESKNISEFITKLQPRFPDVWVYHAWNQAFNISVETFTPEERWDWVKSGIEMLRDEGLVYNPNSVQLYKELGWQLFFKVGKTMDDAHVYYKTRWAEEWNEVLGDPPRTRVGDRKEASGIPVYQATEDFARIADAAETYFTGERRVDPVTQFVRDHPDVRPLVDALHAAEIPFDVNGLRRIGRYLALEPYLGGNLASLKQRVAAGEAPAADRTVIEIVADPTMRKQLDTLLPLWRAKVLIEHYHMKPQKMLEVMRLYGPMDWRHPASHAAYFGYMGVQMAGELRNDNKVDVLNTSRGDIHATQLLQDTGTIIFNPLVGAHGTLDLLPDPRFIPAYEIAWEKAIDTVVSKRDDWQGNEGSVQENFAAGHENFLIKAILLAYFYGDEADARRYFNRARELYGEKWHNKQSGRYEKTLNDLIFHEFASDWSMPTIMLSFVKSQIERGIVAGIRVGRMDVFNRSVGIAKEAWDRHKNDYDYSNIVTGEARLALARSWEQMLANVYVDVMKSPSLSLLERARIWHNTPPALQLSSYVLFRGELKRQCDQQQVDFEKTFPPPAGFVEPDALSEQDQQKTITDIERQ